MSRTVGLFPLRLLLALVSVVGQNGRFGEQMWGRGGAVRWSSCEVEAFVCGFFQGCGAVGHELLSWYVYASCAHACVRAHTNANSKFSAPLPHLWPFGHFGHRVGVRLVGTESYVVATPPQTTRPVNRSRAGVRGGPRTHSCFLSARPKACCSTTVVRASAHNRGTTTSALWPRLAADGRRAVHLRPAAGYAGGSAPTLRPAAGRWDRRCGLDKRWCSGMVVA
jgi:hypothetical protein